MKDDTQEMLQDMLYFVTWIVVGAIVGWILAIMAYRGQIIYEKLDMYGMFGAMLAVFWATFRRLKHVEHLGHIRKHLAKKK
ncbi:hypothetical protein ACFLQI_02980 [Candidatus Undinarchaeota archaeon]